MSTMSVNVFEYFHRSLGVAPRDPTLRQLPIVSPCGVECVAVINAGFAYLERIPIMFERSRHDERNSCILWG
jgi:hypothetical protein